MDKYHVYGVRNGSLLKIGISKNIKSRMAALQNGSGVRLALVVLWELRDRATAHAVEQHLHKTFAAHRRHGEWFEVRADQVNTEMVKVGHLYLAQSAPDARVSVTRYVRGEGPPPAPQPMVKATRHARKYLTTRRAENSKGTYGEFMTLENLLHTKGLTKVQAVRLAYISTGRTRTFERATDGMYREHGKD